MSHSTAQCQRPSARIKLRQGKHCSLPLAGHELHVDYDKLPGTKEPRLQGWAETNLRNATATGERAQMSRKKWLQVTVAGQAVHRPLWLASIQDSCIIGLDLLTRWGAMDVSRATLLLGTQAVALRTTGEDEPLTRGAATSATPESTKCTPAALMS